MSEYRELPVPDGLVGERVDVAVSKLLGLSRSFAAEIVQAGGVLLDGRVLGKSERLSEDGWLQLSWTPKAVPTVVPISLPDLSIVAEDDDLVVIDKPAGVAAHPSLGWQGPTVLGALAGAGFRLATSGAEERRGIVHRLDAGTSGLMVVAKSELAYHELKRAFKEREVEKIYRTLVQGRPDPMTGTIDAPIGRHPGSAWKFAVTRDGKPSITHYETVEAFRSVTLLDVELETGRTHQIRVHMAAQRHPCAGDTMYGADPALAAHLGLGRQWLHATRLGFRHPVSGTALVFESRPAPDLLRALELIDEA